MNRSDHESFCDRWLAAWTGNRPGALLQFYSRDAFYSDPTVKQGLRGHDAILPYLTKLLRNNPEWRWTREELYPADKGFVLKWKAAIPVREREIVEYGMDIVEIADGVITRNEVYFDPRALIEAILKK